MHADDDLYQLLPTSRTRLLADAIGRRLVDVERLFLMDPARFADYTRFSPQDFFTRNSGPVRLCFQGGISHTLVVWGEQMSLVVLGEPLRETEDDRLYRLSQTDMAPARLKACLGRTCRDVRIWTLHEEFEADEARQAGVSYLFDGEIELFYSIYMHGDLDSDYLLPGEDVPRDRVEACLSLARRDYIDRG